jgi:hypothetical protein
MQFYKVHKKFAKLSQISITFLNRFSLPLINIILILKNYDLSQKHLRNFFYKFMAPNHFPNNHKKAENRQRRCFINEIKEI